jgi:phosphoglycerate kinase
MLLLMIKFVDKLKREDLEGKKVLLRADFDVPIKDGKITEEFRVKAQRETLDYLTGAGARILMVAHLGHNVSGASFNPAVEQLGEILGQTLTLVPFWELGALDNLFNASSVLLLDNIRQNGREVENDEGFAQELSAGFSLFVNDAFAVCHREHASVSAITRCLPSYAGFLIKRETENLSEALKAPATGKVVVLGGAKISTKLPVIKNFLGKAEKILIGGAIANSFFKARGIQIGTSVVDDTAVDVSDPRVVLPERVVVASDKTGKSGATSMPVGDIAPNQMIVDICPEFAQKFAKIIQDSKMTIWNGPMGLSEVEKFAQGTRVVAQAVASASRSIVGGGAMLEFLAGNKLPGLEALGYYD